MHYLSSVYFVSQPLHVSSIFVAHHQDVYCIYTTNGACCAFQLTACWPIWDGTLPLADLGWNSSLDRFRMELFHPNSVNRQSAKKHNTYQLLYIYSIPPDDGLQIRPKHVEVF